ncbi:MAG: nucleoside-diphosphate sugar epimerase/dehydratase [Phycisphaerales bacterium]
MPDSLGKRILNGLAGWPRSGKQALIASVDAVILPFSIWAAFALRIGDAWPDGIAELWWLFPSVVVVGIPVLAWFGLYREVVRHAGPKMVVQAAQGVGVTALCVAAMILLSRDWAPRSLPIIFFLVALALVTGSRSLARHLLRSAIGGERRRVVVWGSGLAGARLVQSLVAGQDYQPVAIVDDDPAQRGTNIRGVPVRPASELESIVDDRGVTHVFLALPQASPSQRRAILERVTRLPVVVRSVAPIDEVLAGRATWDETREIPVEDLLGREPVPPDMTLLARCVRGRSVLVTGAGGSIGSQLCREAIALRPSKLVLFERSEHALYQIEQELLGLKSDVEIIPLLGSVLDRDRFERVLRTYAVETVYHAAAFKHVPMVERNIAEGIENNALGTLVAAGAAIAAGVNTFVLISTDKAVRPTSVMGATKRLAELILQALSQEKCSTVFSMVRFGNVLGSSGSVVPLFREQIAKGGPVTVTHPEVIRYFMTIPEAAQLVMQAGAMAEGGEVFLLDMGEPVRIAQLAERMIRLAGRSVREPDARTNGANGEVEIVYTGLRPGEKLYEELLIDADAESTRHPRVKKAREQWIPWARLQPQIERLALECRQNDVNAMLGLLAQLVPEYERPSESHDLLWDDHEDVALAR